MAKTMQPGQAVEENVTHEEMLDEDADQEEQVGVSGDVEMQILPTFANGKEISHYLRDLPRSMAANGKSRTYSRVFKLLKSRDMLPVELQSVRTYSVMNGKQHKLLVDVLESIPCEDVGLMERLHSAVYGVQYTGNTPTAPSSDYMKRKEYESMLAQAMAAPAPLEIPHVIGKSTSIASWPKQANLEAELAGDTNIAFLSDPIRTHVSTSSNSNGVNSSSAHAAILNQANVLSTKKRKAQSLQDSIQPAQGHNTSLASLFQGAPLAKTDKTAHRLQKKVIMAELEQSLQQKRKDGDIANLRAALADPSLDFDVQERKKMRTKLLELMGVNV